MILGVNWYREFPIGLYSYKYFEFQRSVGGFADWPAELYTSVKVEDSHRLINSIEILVQNHKQARIFMKQSDNYFYFMVGWYNLYDYDFLIVLEIEKILNELNANKISKFEFKNVVLLKLGDHDFYNNQYYPRVEGLTNVHSEMGKHNSLVNALRFDCQLNNNKVRGFLTEIKSIANQCQIFTIYYSQIEMHDTTCLYVFMTNGRQGVALNDMVISDGKLLEKKLLNLMNTFDLNSSQNKEEWKSPSKEIIVIDVQDKDYHQLVNVKGPEPASRA